MADLRDLLGQALDDIEPEIIRKMVREALTYEKEKQTWVSIKCRSCGVPGRYPVIYTLPDHRERAKVLDILLNQAKGRPKETKRVEVETFSHNVYEMTLAELEVEEKRLLNSFPDLEHVARREISQDSSS